MCVDYTRPVYSVNEWEADGKKYYGTDLNADNCVGILRFSHELSFTVSIDGDGNAALEGASELNCSGDWEYDSLEEFESDHPGLFADFVSAIKEGRIR